MSETSTPQDQKAKVSLRAGPVTLQARVRVTPAGLMAIGGLVGSILLSTAALVWTAGSAKRGHLLK